MQADFVIVGAGFAGCTLAERLAGGLSADVLVVEKRGQSGGNCYDCYDENGILIHKYGPHIFHTGYESVWKYLSGFTQWRSYSHRVLGMIDGVLVPIPFNFTSMERLFSPARAGKLQRSLSARYGADSSVTIQKLRESADTDLKELADFVYNKVFLNYTVKQWGCTPEQLDPSVTARVPIYLGRDDRYFQDRFQAMPADGYSPLFEKMLSSKNITLLLNTDVHSAVTVEDNTVKVFGKKFDGYFIYTGPIDYLFGYRCGRLPYRTLRFEFEHLPMQYYQPVATVNYPNDYDFTRITEFKHLTGQQAAGTTIAREFPGDYDPDVKERDNPCYVIDRAENLALYAKYKKLADALPNTILVGRLAEYRYYNIDQVVARALEVFEHIKGAN